jgi:hypothetical protein
MVVFAQEGIALGTRPFALSFRRWRKATRKNLLFFPTQEESGFLIACRDSE